MSAADHPLEETIRRTIREEQLIDPGDTVLVGLSGGIDSSTLLFLLQKLKLQDELSFGLAAAHINHQLRGEESQRDETFVKRLCGKFGLACHSITVDVHTYSRSNGLSLQHAGRDLRYAFFEQIARKNGYGKIAVAHNRDDQIETFLLRVVKGTGIHGLSSIPIKRGNIIRPLLRAYRSEVEDYVRRFRIPYVQDSSNQKDTYERNYLRNRVVPLIERLNPRFREKILLLMRDLSSVNTLFDDEAELFLVNEEHREQGDIRFSVEVLKQLHPETRFRVISRTLSRLASTVQPGSTERPHFVALREHVLLVEKSLLSARPNNRVDLPHGIKVRRVYGEIIFTRKQSTVAPACSFDIEPGENQIPSLGVNLTVSISNERPAHLSEGNETAFFDAEKISSMTVRTFREGDRFMPLGMKASVKLKDYFISKKIPRDNRRNIPLLTSNGQIIWIVGQRMDERYKVTDGTVRFLKIKAQFVL